MTGPGMASYPEQESHSVSAGDMTPEESAAYSSDYRSAYRCGLGDARTGESRSLNGRSQGYLDGYRRGHFWGTTHPVIRPDVEPADREAGA